MSYPAFSKFYAFGALEVRLFWINEGRCAATFGVNPAASADEIGSDKPLGLRVGEALRGTLSAISEAHKAGDLSAPLHDAGRAALIDLAAAVGLKKDTKKSEAKT